MIRIGNELNLQEVEGSCNEPFSDLLKISGKVGKLENKTHWKEIALQLCKYLQLFGSFFRLE